MGKAASTMLTSMLWDGSTPTPIYAPTIPSEDESPELPRRNFPTSSKRAEMFSPSVPQSSASGSYAFVHTPNSEEDNPMFQPDPVLFRVRKLTEAMKIPRGRGQVTQHGSRHISWDFIY